MFHIYLLLVLSLSSLFPISHLVLYLYIYLLFYRNNYYVKTAWIQTCNTLEHKNEKYSIVKFVIIIQENKYNEFITYCPEYKNEIKKIYDNYNFLINKIKDIYNNLISDVKSNNSISISIIMA